MIRRFAARRDFDTFKDETEGNIIKLALDSKDTNGKLDQLIQEFSEFKDVVYRHMDATVNAIQGLKQEQAFTNQTLKEWEPKIDNMEKDIGEIKIKLNKLNEIDNIKMEVGNIKTEIDNINAKIEKIDIKLEEISKKLG